MKGNEAILTLNNFVTSIRYNLFLSVGWFLLENKVREVVIFLLTSVAAKVEYREIEIKIQQD